MLIQPIDIIKTSWKFYTTNWKKFIIYLLLLFIPTILLKSIGLLSSYYSSYAEDLYITSTVITVIAFTASILFSLWISIALTKAIKRTYKNEPLENWKKMISNNTYLIWPVILTSIMTTALVVIGSILFLIPGIIFFVWYSFTFYEVMFNDKKSTKALASSKSLVVGRWWSILWRMLVPGITFGILMAIIISLILLPIKFFIPPTSTLFEFISNIVGIIINLALTPLLSVATLILYFSARENPIEQTLPSTNELPTNL